jgi:carboxylesterase type B
VVTIKGYSTHGFIRGHINEVGIRKWKGIPYAAPPAMEVSNHTPNQVYEANFNAPGIQMDLK